MNEQLEIIGTFGQLGMGGLMVAVTLIIWNKLEARTQKQQERDDERWAEVRLQDKAMLEQTLAVLERQGDTNLKTAALLQQAAADLRVATDRLSCTQGGGR